MSSFDIPVTHSAPLPLKRLPVLRQAFALASLLTAAGTLGGIMLSPYFFVLPFMVSGGLMVSAVLGKCPMVFFLRLLPGNRPTTPSHEGTQNS